MNQFLHRIFLSFSLAFVIVPCFCQDQTDEENDAYTKVITGRADKIVKTLAISDVKKSLRVRNIITSQYRNLSAIHDARDTSINSVNAQKGLSAEDAEERISRIKSETTAKLEKLRSEYLEKLSNELTPGEVDKVKDGMTYGVLPITFTGYLEMIPGLTEGQKKQIMAYLLEAREHAMDAGSSEEKHAWFGKYKGKINNYLSAAGYDLKKAGEEWQRRRKAGKAK